jgi:hypothetical protein
MRCRLLLGCLVALGFGSFCPAALGAVQADFNGDGRSDLAVGVPQENVGTVSDAGAVNVLYGATGGLSSAGNQLWSQDSVGIQGVAQAANLFGRALAAGDFDGDGRADLAVGVPGEDFSGSGPDTGAINVLYGGPDGLSSIGNQLWHQGTAGVLGDGAGGEQFGRSLATGDFNGDGHADLAVGVPFDDVAGVFHAGAVNVLYGSPGGLTATGNQRWHQESTGVLDAAEANDNFGWSLAARDFNGNGRADLAVGVPHENVGTISDAGAVNVLYGAGTGGLTATGNQFWRQGGSGGVVDAAEANDNFGSSLAGGDFNGNGRSDLAVGVPLEDVGTVSDAGAVSVLYGAGTGGLTATGNQFWRQGGGGVLDTAEGGDKFGSSLAGGDFNGNGRTDLAVGVPLENIGTISDAGAVSVLYGNGTGGLSATGNQFWRQGGGGVLDTAEAGDNFGSSLGGGDFNANVRADLAVGVPRENLGTISDAGAVSVLYGNGTGGLSATGNQFWHQNSTGVLDAAEAGDNFGWALPIPRG